MITDPAASQPGTHLDPDRMADLVEGLLDTGTADAARAHLASCRLCSADFALIAGETDDTSLADLLPAPPIPHDVMARVEAALHREPPLRPATATAPASRIAAPRRRRFRLALGSLAGATLVVAGGLGVFLAQDTGSSAKSGTNSVAGRPATGMGNSEEPQKSVGNAPAIVSPHSDGLNSSQGFQDLSIERQAENLLGAHMTNSAGSADQSEAQLCRPAAVPAGTQVLADSQTQYAGKSALLLVYPDPGSKSVADVYVVDLGSCTSDKTGQVLYSTTVTRP